MVEKYTAKTLITVCSEYPSSAAPRRYTGCAQCPDAYGSAQCQPATVYVRRELYASRPPQGSFTGSIRSVYFAARARVNFLPRPLTAGHLHATPCVRVLPHCGISLAKLSFYGHIVECSKQDDSDSPFEIPSDDEPLMEVQAGEEKSCK